MRVNLLLVVLLGLLALSYGFKIERRGKGRKGQGGGRGPPDGDKDEDFDDDFDDDDDDDDDDMGGRRKPDLPRLIVGVIAKRIEMQLDNCDLSEFDSEPTTIKGAIQSLGELLLMDCGPGTGPTGPPPTGSSPGTTGNPPTSTDGTLPARELEDKVVRELLTFIEKNRH